VGATLTIAAAREAVVDFIVPYGGSTLQILVNTQYGLGSGVQYLSQDNQDLRYLKVSLFPLSFG
jgi:hypothetical protein